MHRGRHEYAAMSLVKLEAGDGAKRPRGIVELGVPRGVADSYLSPDYRQKSASHEPPMATRAPSA